MNKENNIWAEKNLIEQEKNCSNNFVSEQDGSTNVTENRNVNVPSKTITKVSGIYKIVNKINGKYYVGKSININFECRSRWSDHKRKLVRNKHKNSKLQNAWNKYDEENFDWVIQEVCKSFELTNVEQKYLNIARQEPQKSEKK